MARVLFTISNPCGCSVQLLEGSLPSPTGIDFITKYLDPDVSDRWRTPKHEHLIGDIISKGASNPNKYRSLLDYFSQIIDYHKPTNRFPQAQDIGQVNPELRQNLIVSFKKKHLFHIEDLLQIYESIVWQEITRYPQGRLSRLLLSELSRGDTFSAVGTATRKRA